MSETTMNDAVVTETKVNDAEKSKGTWLGATIWADLRAFGELKGKSPSNPLGLIDILLHPGVMAVILFRLAQFFHRWYLRPISRLLYILNCILFSCELMPSSKVGPGLAIPHPIGVGISAGAVVGRNVRILGLARLGGTWGTEGQPVIGDGCWLLDGAKVWGPVTVGDRTVIASDTTVLKSVPGDVLVAGRPARVVGPRSKLDVAARLA